MHSTELELFTITKQWLQQYSTAKGGYNIKQLHSLGLAYPPKKGWQDRLVGTQIKIENKTLFEYYAEHGNKRGNSRKPTYEERLRRVEAELKSLQREFRSQHHNQEFRQHGPKI